MCRPQNILQKIATALLFLSACTTGTQRARVVKVVDGDTLIVELLQSGEELKVRLAGVDCPETSRNAKCRRDGRAGRRGCAWQIPFGKRARRFAQKLLTDKVVTLRCDGGCKVGSFGRALRYVHLLDGRDYGWLLIKLGLCEDFSFKYPHGRSRNYKQVQQVAQRKRQGIWAVR